MGVALHIKLIYTCEVKHNIQVDNDGEQQVSLVPSTKFFAYINITDRKMRKIKAW